MTARTNIGAKLYIHGTGSTPTALNTDQSKANFDALIGWIEIPNVGTIGDTGVEQNMVSYATWGERLTQQLKGSATGAQAEIRVLDVASNGLDALKAAADITDLNNYGFKVLWPDDSIEFARGVVGAPSFTKGSNEDFAEAVFMLALNQEPVFSTEPE